jgi:hypothetical protein
MRQAGAFRNKCRPTVSGKDPATLYPKLPTSSPWSNPIEAVEPPLGFSVDETPIVGESFEVEASLNQDFGWRKTIQDGASRQHEQHARPGASGFSIGPTGSPNRLGTSSPADGDTAEATRMNPTGKHMRQSPAAAEREGGEVTLGRLKATPPSQSKIIRRLV